MQTEAPSPATLLERARHGDTAAYGDLCLEYETRLLRQALTLCGNESLAEDLAEDTLVEGWKALNRYNGKCQFFTWLCAILLNRYRNTVRNPKRSTEPLDVLEDLPDPSTSPDAEALRMDEASLIIRCIQELPEKHQQVLYLRFYVDDSLEGIAAALRCSVGTVKSRLFRALDKLRTLDRFKSHFPNNRS